MSDTCPVVRIKSEGPTGWAELDESAFDPAVHTLFEPSETVLAGIVSIPDDWQALHWKQRVALAEKLNGDTALVQAEGQTQADAADAVIAAEVARRAA